MSPSEPCVSIVTPSYNQAPFLEATLRSVLDQDYPRIEYIVVDGGSTDGSLEIISKYASRLAYWTSRPDRGQAHAVNKGFARATGTVVSWLNSDDVLRPGAVRAAVEALAANPASGLVYSDGEWIDADGRHLFVQHSRPTDARRLLSGGNGIPQPTVFMRHSALTVVGALNESLHVVLDYELWVRFAFRFPLTYVPGPPWAALRAQPDQKTRKRFTESMHEQLRVLDWALARPEAPAGLGRQGNVLYARTYWELATASRRDWRTARAWWRLAWQTHPAWALTFGLRRIAGWVGRAVLPQPLLARVRGRLD